MILTTLLAAQAATVDRAVPLNKDARVSVELVCGTVSVVGTSAEELTVKGTVGDDAELKLRSSNSSARITIEKTALTGSEVCTDLEIELPAKARLELVGVSTDLTVRGVYGGLELSTVSGDIDLEDAVCDTEIETVSGDVEVRKQARTLEVETVSGDLDVTEGSATLLFESVSGDLEVSGGPWERVEAESVSGDMTLEGALAKNARIELASHSGELEVALPSDTSAELSATSFSGGIDSDFGSVGGPKYGPGTSLEHTLGSGNGRVELTAFSGRVTVRSR